MPAFLVFIAIACALLWLANSAIYKGLISIFTISNPGLILVLKVGMIVLEAGFVVARVRGGRRCAS